MGKVTLVVAAIMAFMTISIESAAVGNSDCIIIMGGGPFVNVDKLPIEYYHPLDDVECSHNHSFPNFILEKDLIPVSTSGCYLTGPQMMVLREARRQRNKSTVYWLQNGTTTQIAAAHSPGVQGSASVSMDLSRCLSCGGSIRKAKPSYEDINQCYEFDAASSNKWTFHSILPHAVSSPALVSLGSHFYLAGGTVGKARRTKKVYRYVSTNSTWTPMQPMAHIRMAPSAAPVSDHEFIVCGVACPRRCPNIPCEIYNTKKNAWRTVDKMITGRSFFQMVTFNDQIYAIGGRDVQWKLTESVEVYNKKNEGWSKVKSLKLARNSFVAFPIALPPKTTTTLTTTETQLQTTQPSSSATPTTRPISSTTQPVQTSTQAAASYSSTTSSKAQALQTSTIQSPSDTNRPTTSAATTQLQQSSFATSPTVTSSTTPTTHPNPSTTQAVRTSTQAAASKSSTTSSKAQALQTSTIQSPPDTNRPTTSAATTQLQQSSFATSPTVTSSTTPTTHPNPSTTQAVRTSTQAAASKSSTTSSKAQALQTSTIQSPSDTNRLTTSAATTQLQQSSFATSPTVTSSTTPTTHPNPSTTQAVRTSTQAAASKSSKAQAQQTSTTQSPSNTNRPTTSAARQSKQLSFATSPSVTKTQEESTKGEKSTEFPDATTTEGAGWVLIAVLVPLLLVLLAVICIIIVCICCFCRRTKKEPEAEPAAKPNEEESPKEDKESPTMGDDAEAYQPPTGHESDVGQADHWLGDENTIPDEEETPRSTRY